MTPATRNDWEALKLTDAQIESLAKDSAISPEVAKRAGLRSIADAKDAAKLLGRMPKQWEGHLPVLVFPYHIPFQRDPVLSRGRPGKPFETPKGDGSVELAKYVQAKNTGTHLYFGPSLLSGNALKDTARPLWITEGEKKALSAESHGLSCIAVPGVSQWHTKGQTELHPYFAHVELAGREVFLAFDRDALANKDVRREELAFGRALERRGAKVYVVRLPEDAPKLDDFFARHEAKELGALIDDARKGGALPPEVVPPISGPARGTAMTDLGNAERFVDQHGGDVRYCAQIGKWYQWRETCWDVDDTGGANRRSMATARSIYAQAQALQDDDARRQMKRWAEKSESRDRLSAMVKLAADFRSIAVRLSDFDSDPWLLNVRNGSIDLRTGKLAPHDKAKLCTRTAPTHFDPDAVDERWLSFLEHVSNGDADIIDFLQRAAGYSLTGDMREEKWFFVHGHGGTGKSSFVLAIEVALGDYAKTSAIESFMEDRNAGGDKPRPDLARLAGARMAVCKEIKQGVQLSENLIKTITGGDTITVRTLNKEPFEMRPAFKLWLVANDPPLIRGDDSGMWRRVIRIPFLRSFENPDRTFKDALLNDQALRSAVLAWAVRGVAKWLERGLEVPASVAASTSDYRAEMDPTGEWIDRYVVFEAGSRVSRKELREAYEVWSKEQGHQAVGARRFASALKERARKAGVDVDGVNMQDERGKWVDGWKHIRFATGFELETNKRWGTRGGLIEGGRSSGGDGDFGGVGDQKPISALCGIGSSQIAAGAERRPLFGRLETNVPNVPNVPNKSLTAGNGTGSLLGTSLGTSEVLGIFEEPGQRDDMDQAGWDL